MGNVKCSGALGERELSGQVPEQLITAARREWKSEAFDLLLWWYEERGWNGKKGQLPPFRFSSWIDAPVKDLTGGGVILLWKDPQTKGSGSSMDLGWGEPEEEDEEGRIGMEKS
jgi:hypothetical protein